MCACSRKAEGAKGSPAKRSKGAAGRAGPQGLEPQECRPEASEMHGSHEAAGGRLELAARSPLRQHCLTKGLRSIAFDYM